MTKTNIILPNQTKKIFKMWESEDGQYYYTVGARGVLATSETFVSETNAVISCMRLYNFITGANFRLNRKTDRVKFMELFITDKIR